MFIAMTLPDIQGEKESPILKPKILNDVLGLGEMSSSFARVIEKLPVEKFPIGLTLFIVINLMFWIVYFNLLRSDNPSIMGLPFGPIAITVFSIDFLIAVPFSIVELIKRIKE